MSEHGGVIKHRPRLNVDRAGAAGRHNVVAPWQILVEPAALEDRTPARAPLESWLLGEFLRCAYFFEHVQKLTRGLRASSTVIGIARRAIRHSRLSSKSPRADLLWRELPDNVEP